MLISPPRKSEYELPFAPHIPSTFKQLATRAAIALFRAIRWLKRGLQFVLQQLGILLAPVGRGVISFLILPVYDAGISINLKLQRLSLPTRSFALFLLSNRYLFHAVLGLATAATIVVNVQARQVLAQDVGHNSLLYALATDSEVEIIKEDALPEFTTVQVSYLSDSALVAVPHIDFDYDEGENEIASLSVPGSISAPLALELAGGTPQATRTAIETYTVKEGDTIGSIAHEFNVNVGTILWSNNLTERQYIRPGDTLKIPPVSGILVTIKKGDTLGKLAQKYQGDEQEIKEFNKIADETSLALGTEIMIPGGKPPVPEQTLIAINSRSREITPTRLRGKTSEALSPKVKKPANANVSSLPSAKLLWPTPGRAITQYYGWKHTGLDIDGDFTSPLYAAYDGVVEKAGWNNGGYGLQVMIRHPNSMVTRYAHASKLFVKVGDAVSRGQVIAMMGSTGRSTGSHLHFELYVGSKRVNPLSYVK